MSASYVAKPNGTGLRLALRKSYRVNVQEAGEKVFVDLLSESWASLPPQLPPEAVAELARLARQAETALKARNPFPIVASLARELAHTKDCTRLSLRLPSAARPTLDWHRSSPWLTLTRALADRRYLRTWAYGASDRQHLGRQFRWDAHLLAMLAEVVFIDAD